MIEIDYITGFAELENHVNLGDRSYLAAATTKCCATGTCIHVVTKRCRI